MPSHKNEKYQIRQKSNQPCLGVFKTANNSYNEKQNSLHQKNIESTQNVKTKMT